MDNPADKGSRSIEEHLRIIREYYPGAETQYELVEHQNRLGPTKSFWYRARMRSRPDAFFTLAVICTVSAILLFMGHPYYDVYRLNKGFFGGMFFFIHGFFVLTAFDKLNRFIGYFIRRAARKKKNQQTKEKLENIYD